MRVSQHALVALMLAVVAPAVPAATYYVRQSGNDAASGKTAAMAFRSVTRAVQAVNHGDSIVIGPGSYSEAAYIGDRLGSDATPISITGDESGKQTGDAAGAVVVQPRLTTEPAISLYKVPFARLVGLTLRGNGQGLKFDRCNTALVQRCTFDSLAKGMAAESCDGVTVRTSVFNRCAIALSVQGSTNASIFNNTIVSSSSAGIVALQSSRGEIQNCILTNNATNLVADSVAAASWTSDYNVITGANGAWGPVPTVQNIYEWSATSDQDRHSVYVAPSFVDAASGDFRIDPAVTWAGGLPGMFLGEEKNPLQSSPSLRRTALVEVNDRAIGPLRKGTLRTTTYYNDRAGNPYRLRGEGVSVGAYDYPQPVAGAGWKKLAAKLDGGPRQSAGVYRADGTLVRTLLADTTGVTELWWDGRDDLGKPVTAGAYQVRAITHDVRLVDDGAVGDNGNPRGGYNGDNVDRIAVLPDGSFVVTAIYDEAGITLRRYNAGGQPIFGSALDEGDFWGLGAGGDDIYGGRGKGKDAQIVRFALPGERAKMATGADSYPLVSADEAVRIAGILIEAAPKGLAVKGDRAYAALGGYNLVRVIDLKTGAKVADWPVTDIGDIARDDAGTLWVVSGKDVVSLSDDGKIVKRLAPGLNEIHFLAAGKGRVAAIDRRAARLALLDTGSGQLLRTLGRDRDKEYFLPVQPDIFRDPRGAAFLPDGRLALLQHARIRLFYPEKPDSSVDLVSNFMESPAMHPTNPEYLYCGLGVFHVDPRTGAWEWRTETPAPAYLAAKPEEDPWFKNRLGSPGLGVVLGGRPFVVGFYSGNLVMLDVTEPEKPRIALRMAGHEALSGWAYGTIAFGKNNELIGSSDQLNFKVVQFKNLDANNNPVFDWANVEKITAKDAGERAMKQVGALTADRVTGDIYYLASTALYNKMVPGWGADGTGVGKSLRNGVPQWFSLSSGGNYMSVSTVNDGKQAWTLAGKSFGGQIDVFDGDGLRVTTGNWSAPSNYTIGFVDLRYGVHGYMRPDGKVGAYVEDDAIGRFARARLDGAATLKRQSTNITWDGAGAAGISADIPAPDRTSGKSLTKTLPIARVAALKVDGDWAQWEKAGIAPQIIALPSNAGFKRQIADDLLRSFREGTMMGALAHDGQNFYAYFVVTDDTQHFDAAKPGDMWRYDGIEMWIEEEQFGLSMTKDGKPALYKWRFHDKAGTQWKANYGLPAENMWATRLTDLSSHPLGRQLGMITGVSMQGKPGYAVMAKIPFDEVKLVGGIAGREGTKISNMTGAPGEVVRFAISVNNISAWGRVQDYMVDWPIGKMFSDPTRSFPFTLAE